MIYFRKFYDLAFQLLNECHRRNEIFTKYLINRNLTNWGNLTCSSIAVISEHSDFITHTLFQDILSCKWSGKLNIRGDLAGIVRHFYLFFYCIKDTLC